jgi:hypothetical protein
MITTAVQFAKCWLKIAQLIFSIQEHGLRTPVVRMGDTVFDGRKRVIACRILGVKPVFHEICGPGGCAMIAKEYAPGAETPLLVSEHGSAVTGAVGSVAILATSIAWLVIMGGWK